MDIVDEYCLFLSEGAAVGGGGREKGKSGSYMLHVIKDRDYYYK